MEFGVRSQVEFAKVIMSRIVGINIGKYNHTHLHLQIQNPVIAKLCAGHITGSSGEQPWAVYTNLGMHFGIDAGINCVGFALLSTLDLYLLGVEFGYGIGTVFPAL